MEIKQFVNKLFESREVAHAVHLSTGKYSQHVALQEYYEGIVSKIDELVETYQGQYGLIGNYTVFENTPELKDVIKYFEELLKFIKKNKKEVFDEEDTHLFNIIDEIVSLICKTLYKLKYLS